jgi:mono/diheme cytochrome c family protein
VAGLRRALLPRVKRALDSSVRRAPAYRYRAVITGIALCGFAFAACGKPRELTAVERGEVVYRTNCVSCHNADPGIPGPLGPAIAGAPRALVEARVLHAAYPPGYIPQRHSHTMRALPWLDGHIDDLTAYLDAIPAHH